MKPSPAAATVAALIAAPLLIASAELAYGDRDAHEDHERHERHERHEDRERDHHERDHGRDRGDPHQAWAGGGLAPSPSADPEGLALYTEECGACHLAYPPALLPAVAWAEVMGRLADHYGDDASLDAQTAGRLLAYLSGSAADTRAGVRPHAFAGASFPADTAPRITATPYFQREHAEIPERLVAGNPEVRSFSACQTCHSAAERGRFDEDEVRIPGYGRWDD